MSMRIEPGTTVLSNDGEQVGDVHKMVLSPVTHQLESLIIQQGALFTEQRVVPARLIEQSSEEEVRLTLNAEALRTLPHYKETHFIDSLASDRGEPGAATLYYLHPVDVSQEGDLLPNYPSPPIVERTVENLPAGSYVLDQGSEIHDRDGDPIGEVKQIIADPASHDVTHFAISRGVIFETEKLIPVQWVDSIEDGKVNLAVEKEVIQQLPEYKS